MFLVNYLETAYLTGQNDRQTQFFSGQIVILAGHCPVTGRYFEPCMVFNEFNSRIHVQSLCINEHEKPAHDV